jgi:hypothetical protein
MSEPYAGFAAGAHVLQEEVGKVHHVQAGWAGRGASR